MFEFIGAIVFGWLVADFVTGFFHWFEDRVGRKDWPIIGPWIVVPNRQHHITPTSFLNSPVWVRNAPVWVATGTVLILCLLFIENIPLWLWVTIIGASFSNEIHGWAHKPKTAPEFALVLQEMGVFQSPVHHARHHREPQENNYCVMTNWLNPVLEFIKFWWFLEWGLEKIGLEPNRGKA